jgi:hypothetical protein
MPGLALPSSRRLGKSHEARMDRSGACCVGGDFADRLTLQRGYGDAPPAGLSSMIEVRR